MITTQRVTKVCERYVRMQFADFIAFDLALATYRRVVINMHLGPKERNI